MAFLCCGQAMCREIVRPGQTLQGAMVIEGAPSMPDVAAKAAVMAGAERSPLAGEECSRYRGLCGIYPAIACLALNQ